jgi:hypothetical protein
MTTIYEQHDKTFSNVSAFVVALKGKRVATIAFKFPRDGVGRLYAYVHWLGEPMVRGFAYGYGYDKRSAACSNAAHKLTPPDTPDANPEPWASFRDALTPDDGETWDSRLRKAGFEIWQAV